MSPGVQRQSSTTTIGPSRWPVSHRPASGIGDTDLGRAGAEAYARRKGVTLEAFLAGFGAPLTPAQVGEHVATLLTDPRYETGLAFGLKGDLGIHSLDG